MASSPSSIPGRRNRPGCMGGVAHLFDFNQALAGRKLLTNKKYGAGLEPSRNTPNNGLEEHKSKTSSNGEFQFGKSASISKRLSEVPIKALVAEEISTELAMEPEPKNRAPSVVARLMGLDALPGDSKSKQKAHRGTGMENAVRNLPSERLQHGKTTSHGPLASTKKDKPPPTRSMANHTYSEVSDHEEYTLGFESLSLQRPEQDFKKEFQTWQTCKSDNHVQTQVLDLDSQLAAKQILIKKKPSEAADNHVQTQALDGLDSQLAAKQILIKKKLSEAKLGLLSKHSGPPGKLYESKEFMDAIDFLQANKDFFLRFLEEPDTLCTRRLQNNEENSVPEFTKHMRPHADGSLENGIRPQPWGKEPPESVKSYQKSSRTDFSVEEKLSDSFFVPPPFLAEAQWEQMLIRKKPSAAKQILNKKKLSEAKLGLSLNHSGPQELYESKEFMDAIDFLQANKDFFGRFLEEPDSVCARHLQNNEENPVPEKVTEFTKRVQTHANGSPRNVIRRQPLGEELPDSVKSHHKSLGTDFLVKNKLSAGGSFIPPFLSEAQRKHWDSWQSIENKVSSSAEQHQAPTRIVVLKPGPGKVRNSQNSSRSPKDLSYAMEVIKENNMDVLHELRERLQQEEGRESLTKTRPNVNEHYKPSKDPREIAREIARQVRENVTRDLMVNSRSAVPSASGVSLGRKIQSDEMANETGGMPGSSNGESCVRRTLDRFKQLNAGRSNVWQPELENAVFERSRHLGDYGWPPHDLRNSGRHSVDDTNVGQNRWMILNHVEIDGDSSTHSLFKSEVDANGRNEERVKDDTCRTLLRSKSVPMGFSLHRSQEEFQGEDPGMQVSDLFVAVAAKVVDTNRSSDATICQVEPSRRSIFSRKCSGSKGSFSKSRKQTSSNKWVDEIPFACKELPIQESSSDALAESEKNQCQIDDTDPVLDIDSSASSLENFLSLEAALMAEDLVGVEGNAHQPSGMGLPTTGSIIIGRPMISEGEGRKTQCECQCIEIVEDSETSMHSPSASPKRLASLASDGTMSINSEVSKGPSEQPSPVSVLDASFHEESASTMEFAEISSGLQELRRHLRLLKILDHEAASNSEAYEEEDGHFRDENPSTTNDLCSNISDLDIAGLDCFSSHNENSDLLDVMECPKGKEPELVYVRNLLVASGFTGDNAAILTRWHAPSQPLASCIFEKMEDNYKAGKIDNKTCTQEEGVLVGSHSRHLLFDRVNEALLEVLGPHVNCRMWWKDPYKSTLLGMPSGKDLLRLVCAEVCKLSCSQYEAQDTLGNLVAKDLARKDGWQDLGIDIGIVVLEVERAIFNDMIQETLMVF